jgi:hypothetical protein
LVLEPEVELLAPAPALLIDRLSLPLGPSLVRLLQFSRTEHPFPEIPQIIRRAAEFQSFV